MDTPPTLFHRALSTTSRPFVSVDITPHCTIYTLDDVGSGHKPVQTKIALQEEPPGSVGIQIGRTMLEKLILSLICKMKLKTSIKPIRRSERSYPQLSKTIIHGARDQNTNTYWTHDLKEAMQPLPND
ncbi:hypothetical protein PoB_001724800 [Plakobranchus ocellatus]|uniref:Uncharacterized protein n=1 Tax=Plakobranchus ocellatus TaxID=259542 RepID=A0AAV3Z8G7_9GAST|nr:hypothetical protein PoB_001724800 [Plakobranchus ocellatus]